MRSSHCVRAGVAVIVGLALAIGAPAAPSAAATEGEDRAYVRALSVDLVGTEPAEEELDQQVARLQDGLPRVQMAREYAFGLENLTQEVEELYQDALDRAPDEEGRNHWVNTMGYTSYPLSEAAARIYGSWEFVYRFGMGNPYDTADALYVRLLDRQPDEAGSLHWADVGSRQGPVGAARGMYQSLEHRRTRVDQVFQEMLGRVPSATDRDFWADRITTLGDLGLAVRLAITSEYDARAQARFGPA